MKKIKQNMLNFNMNSFLEELSNHLRRGHGHIYSYIWNRIQWNYFHRFNFKPSFPLNIDIESSSSCNIKCDHCFRQYLDVPESALMQFEVYQKIVDECAEWKLFTLKFSMRGEPTLHPQIVDMVEYAKMKGIKEVWINTNGSMLTESLCKGLIKAGLDCLTISFDGLGEMYESIRKPLIYSEMLDKLKLLSSLRKELSSQKPYLTAQTLWSAIKDDPESYKNVMKDLVDKISYNIDFDFKDIHFEPDPDYVCYRLWQRLSITSKGNVLKCPSDFEQQEVLGNIKDHSIKYIWDTIQEEERNRHLAGKRLESKVCKKCHHGAKVKTSQKQFDSKNHNVNEIEYYDGFEGVGLNRRSNG